MDSARLGETRVESLTRGPPGDTPARMRRRLHLEVSSRRSGSEAARRRTRMGAITFALMDKVSNASRSGTSCCPRARTGRRRSGTSTTDSQNPCRRRLSRRAAAACACAARSMRRRSTSARYRRRRKKLGIGQAHAEFLRQGRAGITQMLKGQQDMQRCRQLAGAAVAARGEGRVLRMTGGYILQHVQAIRTQVRQRVREAGSLVLRNVAASPR